MFLSIWKYNSEKQSKKMLSFLAPTDKSYKRREAKPVIHPMDIQRMDNGVL